MNDSQTRAAAILLFAGFIVTMGAVLYGLQSRLDTRYPGLMISAKGFVGLKMLADPAIDLDRRLGFADRVIAVNGTPFTGTAALGEQLEALPVGSPLHFVFEQPSGNQYPIRGRLPTLDAASLWGGALPVMLAGLLAVATGLIVVMARPGWEAGRAYFVAAWACGLQLFVLPFDTFLDQRLMPASLAVGSIFFGSILHVSLAFPTKRWPLTRYPIAGVATLYGLLSVPWLWSIANFAAPTDRIDVAVRWLYVPTCYVLATPFLLNAVGTYLRTADEAMRRRARTVLPTTIALAAIVPASELWNRPGIPFELRIAICVAAATALIIAVGTATLKSNLFEVSDRQRRSLSRAVVGSLGLLVYIAAFAAAQRWAGSGSAWVVGFVGALLGAILVWSLEPLRRRFETRVEAALFPERRRTREALQQTASELALLRDLSEVHSVVARVALRTVGAESTRIVIALEDETPEELSAPRGTGMRGRLAPKTLRALAPVLSAAAPIEIDEPSTWPAGEPKAVELLQKLGIALAVPLPSSEGERGALLFTPREDGRRYDAAEVAFVSALAAQSSVTLRNARSVEELERLRKKLDAQNRYLRQEIQEGHDFQEIVGQSPKLAESLAQIGRVAPTDATVLILGETGTGKELVSRAIHESSARREQLIVKLACAAVPESLFESEIFGHEKGAFSGANERRRGRLEVADGGTLFLDDVDALPMAVQPKLLRALQEGEVQRLGSDTVAEVDVRVIAATNKDLVAEVRARRFREDLYYRLNVVPISLPPLRERPEDIPVLAQHFVALAGARYGREVEGLSFGALEQLRGYGWPGNVRELRNVIERAVVLSQGPIVELAAPLGDDTGGGTRELGQSDLEELLRAYKVKVVGRALAYSGGNHRKAAELLGIHRASLTRMVHQLGIEVPKGATVE